MKPPQHTQSGKTVCLCFLHVLQLRLLPALAIPFKHQARSHQTQSGKDPSGSESGPLYLIVFSLVSSMRLLNKKPMASKQNITRTSDRAIERPSDRAIKRPSDRAIKRPSDRAERSSDRATERSSDRMAEHIARSRQKI